MSLKFEEKICITSILIKEIIFIGEILHKEWMDGIKFKCKKLNLDLNIVTSAY